MTLKTPEERIRDAYSAYELVWLLDLSRLVPVPDEAVKILMRGAFLAGVLHGYTEASQDLAELERRVKDGA